jgi:hypothetical protein
VTLIQALQNFLIFAAAIAVVAGALRWLNGQRLKISVRGGPEVTYRIQDGRPIEAFVFYLLSERDHPVTVESCGIDSQDTRGDYWRLNVGMPARGAVVTKGTPYRWEMPFSDIAQFGLDVNRRVYGFARIAQPRPDVWSRRTTAGPTRGTLPRVSPMARGRPAGQSPSPPPWWVRLR